MTPRPPSLYVAVDADILVSAVLGRAGRAAIAEIAVTRTLLTSAEAERETRRRVSDPRLFDPRHAAFLETLFLSVRPVAPSDYAPLLPEAARALSLAPPSGNGSEADAHLLAAAWVTDADIWTHDRDFAGTGWPTWSTRNLRQASTVG